MANHFPLKALEFGRGNLFEEHLISRRQERRALGARFEEGQGGPADQPPPAGRWRWIDTRVLATDGHAARRHPGPRRRQTRGVESRRKPGEIREARREADECDPVRSRSVATREL